MLIEEDINVPVVKIQQTLHSFEHNYSVSAQLFTYPSSKASMFKSKIVKRSIQMVLNNLLMELTRDANVVLGDCRLIFDCHLESIAEINVYEFYNDCLAPSLRSYVEDRTFSSEKSLAMRIQENPNCARELIKLARFTADYYRTEIGNENLELIKEALDKASRGTEEAKNRWAYSVSPLIINEFFLMLASIYHFKGELPEPELYFELWYPAIYDLPKLKELYHPLLKGHAKTGK